jgi:predicted acetyltransferase
MDYRPVPEAHRESFERLVRYAFDPASGPDFDLEDRRPDPEIFDVRGLYHPPGDGDVAPADDGDGADADGSDPTPTGEDLAAICGVFRFTLRVRDDWVPAGGLAAVASAPETRRRGYVSDVLDGVHRELRDDGTPFAILWPFAYPFYRRHGYEQVSRYGRLTVPPDELSAVAARPAGEVVRLAADDWAEIDAIHAAWATESLAVDRTEGWWRRHVFEHWATDPYVYGWRDADGDLRGYVVYAFEDGERGRDDRTMVVRELAGVDETARRQCLRFVRDHDSQAATVRLSDRLDRAIALRTALDDPRAADLEVRPGPMLRAVDLRTAVGAVAFPPDVEARLTLEVRDAACPWNDGVFELTVADGTGRLEAVGGVGDDGSTCRSAGRSTPEATGAPSSSPSVTALSSTDVDVRAGVGALSAALVGAIPVRELATRGDAGGLDRSGPSAATETTADRPADRPTDRRSPDGSAAGLTGDADALETLAACCPAVETYLREGF